MVLSSSSLLEHWRKRPPGSRAFHVVAVSLGRSLLGRKHGWEMERNRHTPDDIIWTPIQLYWNSPITRESNCLGLRYLQFGFCSLQLKEVRPIDFLNTQICFPFPGFEKNTPQAMIQDHQLNFDTITWLLPWGRCYPRMILKEWAGWESSDSDSVRTHVPPTCKN